mgnify:CR=1 FL=1
MVPNNTICLVEKPCHRLKVVLSMIMLFFRRCDSLGLFPTVEVVQNFPVRININPPLIRADTSVTTRDGSHNSSHYEFSAPDQNRENLAASERPGPETTINILIRGYKSIFNASKILHNIMIPKM